MLLDHIYERARAEPSKAALIHNGVVSDYITFARAIETCRRVLERHDLPSGSVAAVHTDNLAEAWALVTALCALGLTTVNVKSLDHAKSLGLKNVSCFVEIEPPSRFRSAFRRNDQSGVTRAGVMQALGGKLVVISRWDLAATRLRGVTLSPRSGRSSGGHILYTSGTTGVFKKLLWDSNREDARVSARSRAHGFDESTVAHLMGFEQQTSIGWKVALAVWRAGGCVVFDQRKDWCEPDPAAACAEPGGFDDTMRSFASKFFRNIISINEIVV